MPRPITRPGGVSGWRVPLTSSTSRARLMVVSLAGPDRSVIPATAWEATVKRPVGSRVSSSKSILIGPLNTYPISRACRRSSPASSAVRVLAYGASLSWSCWDSRTTKSLGTSRLSRDMSFASASSSRCSRAVISTGWTSPLNARAKA